MQKLYKFTQEDLKFVQDLFPDTVKVFLKDEDTIMDTRCVNTNKYIHSIYVNLSIEFFKKIEKYFSKVGQVNWNNTGSCWWICCESNK